MVIMLTQYIDKAMSRVVYEQLEDKTYCGRIPECPGTIAFGNTLYQCQNELKSVLEGWLLVKIRHGDPLPIIDEVDLNKGIPTLKEITARG
jgi:predicted RNase H-like HicB family nuclease